uniref:NUDIX domain-containing protein n=1 Tax=Paenibacillus sp. FSL R5-0470 TaxID=2921641 RepID=UPI00403F4E39
MITFRPVGGTIEYGEDSKSAVIREVKEEINIDIIEPKIDRDYRAHLPLVRRNWT